MSADILIIIYLYKSGSFDSGLLIFDGDLSPLFSHLNFAFLVLLAILVFKKLGFDHFDDLRDGLIFVLDHLFLTYEENVVVKDLEEQRHIGYGLVDTSVCQLGTSLQNFVNAVGISLRYLLGLPEGW